MKKKSRWFVIVLVTVMVSAMGCARQGEQIPTVQIEVNEEQVDVVDHYLEIDRRALVGVDKALAAKAFDGNGATAVAIGNAFAEANHITEARFWYRIAAENGNAIGMANTAVAARELECRRANYWLREALAKGRFGKETEDSMRRSLKEYEASCK